MLFLAIWLLASGLVVLLGVNFPSQDVILALLAVAAGVLIIIGDRKLRFSGNLGMLLLAIWLIAYGLIQVVDIRFPAAGTILAILAIAAGVLLLLKR
jgi:hypothetical protein